MGKIWKYAYAVLFWLYVGFFVLMSFDIQLDKGIVPAIVGFLIHNVPTIILLLTNLFTKDNPKVRGIALWVLAIASVIFFRTYRGFDVFLYVTGPLIALGGLAFLQTSFKEK